MEKKNIMVNLKPKKKDTRTHRTSIGFGMTLGGILTLLIMIPFFGNDKEALCVIPVVKRYQL
jgi:hypothetical protein